MESQSLYQELPPAAPVEKASVIEDFVDVFYAPSKVFERRRDGQFGMALLLLLVIFVVIFFATKSVLQPAYDGAIDQQIAAARAQNPNMNPEQLATMRGVMAKTFAFGPIVGVPVLVLAVGAMLFFIGKLFDSKQTFSQAMMVATYAQVPRFVLGGVVSAAQAFFIDPAKLTSPFSVTIGAARFAPDASAGMLALLNRFELFTIWATVLLGLGLAITGKVTVRQGMMAAALVWLVATLVAGVQFMATR